VLFLNVSAHINSARALLRSCVFVTRTNWLLFFTWLKIGNIHPHRFFEDYCVYWDSLVFISVFSLIKYISVRYCWLLLFIQFEVSRLISYTHTHTHTHTHMLLGCWLKIICVDIWTDFGGKLKLVMNFIYAAVVRNPILYVPFYTFILNSQFFIFKTCPHVKQDMHVTIYET
jgi:hypothetical protein